MTLFINYDVNNGVTINAFRNQGYFNEDVLGLVEDIVQERSGCCELAGAEDAINDGALWKTSAVEAEVLEMIQDAINEFTQNI